MTQVQDYNIFSVFCLFRTKWH